MALNRQTFKTRALTAIIFAVVMLLGLLWNQWSFLILFTVIHFGCWWEYLRLSEKINQVQYHPYIKLGLMIIGYGVMLIFCRDIFNVNGYSIRENLSLPVSAAGFAMLILGIFQKQRIDLKAFGMAFLGIIYISLSWGLFVNFYAYPTGNPVLYKESFPYLIYFPLFLIACMWINDTMAYLVGSLIGKTPLSSISPKKTWEGTIGGILLSSLIVGYIGYIYDDWFVFGHSLAWWIGLATVVSIAGTLGDLFESKLKRIAKVKDSGTFMPGHGGFLDRFDSLLLASIFASVYVTLVRP